jgi:hypothetical protein
MDGEDWLGSLDAAASVPPDQMAAVLEFAQNYRVFEDDPRGRALLAHWRESLSRKRVGPGASVQEYAYAEAQRAFILGIEDQLRLAATR